MFLMSVVPIPSGLIWPWLRAVRLQSFHGLAPTCGPVFADPCNEECLVHANLLHGPCRRFRGDQNDEDTRTFCGKFLYNAIASADNAQHKNCPSSGIDDRPGGDLFRVLKRSPISQPHTLGLRRGYSDGKAVGNTNGLRRRLNPRWRISLLHSLCRALGQTEASSNF